METTEIRARAEAELSKAIMETLGVPAQRTNPESMHAKLGCTLIAMLPDETLIALLPAEAMLNGDSDKAKAEREAAKERVMQKMQQLKWSHEKIGAEFGLTPIGDGPKGAAGGAFVIYLGYKTEYAKSLQR